MKHQQNKASSTSFIIFAVLHLICCGLPLLLLSGVSLAFVSSASFVLGSLLLVLSVVGLIWYIKRGCAACPTSGGQNHALIEH